MEEYHWIGSAKVVAYIDLIICSIILLGLALTMLYAICQLTHTVITARDSLSEVAKFIYIPCGIFPGVLAILISVNLWSAVMLFKAATQGADPAEAFSGTLIWGIVSIVFVFPVVIVCYRSELYYALAGYAIFRGILLFLVFKFMLELKQEVTSSTPSSIVEVLRNKTV